MKFIPTFIICCIFQLILIVFLAPLLNGWILFFLAAALFAALITTYVNISDRLSTIEQKLGIDQENPEAEQSPLQPDPEQPVSDQLDAEPKEP